MVYDFNSSGDECSAGRRSEHGEGFMSSAERVFRFWAALAFGMMMLLGGCVIAVEVHGPDVEDEEYISEETAPDVNAIEVRGVVV